MLRGLALLFALGLAISACGGGDDGSESGDANLLGSAGVTIGFEEGQAGWTSLNGAKLSQDTSKAQSGKSSLKVKTNGSSPFQGVQSASVPVDSGQTYVAFARVRAPKGAKLQITLRERNSADAEVDGTVTAIKGTGRWDAVQVERTFGRRGENARIQVRTDDRVPTLAFRIDGVVLQEVAAG